MQRYHDKWNRTDSRDSFAITPLLAINGIIVLALIVLALSSPSASEWISAAAQAEFAVSGIPATPSTQIAQPADEMRIVRSN